MKDIGKIMIAAAAGLLAGGIAGILLAPDKGSETRKKIVEGGKKVTDSVKDKWNTGKSKITGLRDRITENRQVEKGELEEIL